MSSAFWIGVIIFAIVFFGWLIWEAVTAPVMPDDYDMTDEELTEIENEVDEKLANMGKKLLYSPQLQMRMLHIDMIAEQIAQLEDNPSKGSVIIQMASLFKRVNANFDEQEFVRRCMNIKDFTTLKKY